MKYSQKIKDILIIREITQDTLARDFEVTLVSLNRWIHDIAEPRDKNKKKIDEMYFDLIPNNRENLENSIDIHRENKKQIQEKCQSFNIKVLLQQKQWVKSLVVSMTHATNRLEGSTMTIEEVSDVLYENTTFAHRSLLEHIEAKNHETALLYVLDNYHKDIHKEYVQEINKILMNSIKSDAGLYRSHNVRIHGSYVPTANYMSIDKKMNEFFVFVTTYKNKNRSKNSKSKDNKSRGDVFNFLAHMHAMFEIIHPFSDGNGRTGRLLIAHLCLQYELLPAIISPEYRKKYLHALQEAQLNNTYEALEVVLMQGVEKCISLTQ